MKINTYIFTITLLLSISVCFGNQQLIADELFGYINLKDSSLTSVKEKYESGQYEQALDEYKDIFLDRVGMLDISNMPGSSSNADSLLNDNIVRIYNNAGGYEIQDIGEPGQIDWYLVTDYTSWAYSLSNMHWTSSLVVRYSQSPPENAQYLQKWVEYWNDFSQNNYDQWLVIKDTPEQDNHGSGFRLIWTHRLILGDRIRYLLAQLSAAMDADAEMTKSIITGEQLAVILNEMAHRNMGQLNDVIHGGVPNQVITSSLGLVQAGMSFVGFNDASVWESTGTYEVNNYLYMYCMPDGTDMEQSFNYNGMMIDVGREIVKLYDSSGQSLPEWIDNYQGMMLNRFRFLSSIVRPNGMLPSLAKQSDVNAYGRISNYQEYFDDYLVEQIIDHTWIQTPTLPEPAFNSIYFPFGGYCIFRDGWHSNSHHMFMKNSRMGKGHYDESSNQVQITAFGRTMLIDSGGSLYVPDYRNYYFQSSFAHNTIVVDGKSQVMGGEFFPAYSTTVDARYYTDNNFGFIEGSYGAGINGGYGSNSNIEINDVTHKRQVCFLKDIGIYILTDRLISPNTHTYTQIWNFDKDYERTNVNLVSPDKIMTNQPFQSNVSIYNFFPSTLSYTRYHGFYDGDNVYGWAKDGTGYVPAVDTHRSWTGTGDQLLVTLLVPMQRTTEPLSVLSQSSNSDITTFEAETNDGVNIKYAARKSSGEISLGNIDVTAKSLLVKTMPSGEKKCIVLDNSKIEINGDEYSVIGGDSAFTILTDGSFEVDGDIVKPAAFSWVQSEDSYVPNYETIQYNLNTSVEPEYVTTIQPNAGSYTVADNTLVSFEASDFVDCPYVAGFDHWIVDGEFYSSEKQVSIKVNSDIDVVAVFTDDRRCGDVCHPILEGDFNADCRVDIKDLKILVSNWLESSL